MLETTYASGSHRLSYVVLIASVWMFALVPTPASAQSEVELCQTTGGSWDTTACGHSRCGVPSMNDCVSPGCQCPAQTNFTVGAGCLFEAVCLEDASVYTDPLSGCAAREHLPIQAQNTLRRLDHSVRHQQYEIAVRDLFAPWHSEGQLAIALEEYPEGTNLSEVMSELAVWYLQDTLRLYGVELADIQRLSFTEVVEDPSWPGTFVVRFTATTNDGTEVSSDLHIEADTGRITGAVG